MKLLFYTLFFVVFPITLYSQSHNEYYVVQKKGHSIEPSSKALDSNSELILNFSKTELQNLFSSKVIFEYEKAFPESKNDTLKNTYWVKSDLNLLKSELEQLSDVLFVEELDFIENYLLHEPNDYFFEINNVKNQTLLDLIRAPLAWEITTGDPNIIIGVVDNPGKP